jgi:hypothetical protein
MSARLVRPLLPFALVAATAAGCASGPAVMVRVQPPLPLAARRDSALVVFVRPSGWGRGIAPNIIDEAGHLLGESKANSHFAVAVPPGHHMFVTWTENTDALVADLAPGHIYFVEVYVTPGVFVGQAHLKAIKPTLPNWLERDAWMRQTRQNMTDPVAASDKMARIKPSEIEERLRRGSEHMQKYNWSEVHSRSMTPADGI